MKKKNRQAQKKKKDRNPANQAAAVKQDSQEEQGMPGLSFRKNHLVYDNNIQALKKRFPELARQVQKTIVQNCEIIPAENNSLPNLLVKNKNIVYYQQDNPLAGVKKQLDDLKLKNNRLAIFLGFGLGYELNHYLRYMSQEQNTSFILVIEKDLEIFKAALSANDLTPLLSNTNIHFLVGMPEDKLYVELRNYLADNSRFMFLKAMHPVYHSSSLRLDKDYYLNALKHLRESGAHQILHFGNDPHDSLIGVENMLENIDEIIFNPGVNLLYNKFRGKPAVVIATGPSLNKNKHLLKGLEDKALLIAADASLKVMMDLGVKPHLVTSLERVPLVEKLIDGFMQEEVEEVYFAACPVICNEVYRAYPGPRLIVYRNFDHFKWLGVDRGILNIQLSSGNMAFKVAEALGCDPIILIGQDLAFSRDGDTHARDTALGERQEGMYRHKMLDVMGNDGKPIRTMETWYTFLKAYEMDIAGYSGTCINSTEGGALIKGTDIMPFSEAIRLHVSDVFGPLDIIKKNISRFTDSNATTDFEKVTSLIEETITDMEMIVNSCKEGLDTYNLHKKDLIKLMANQKRLEDEKTIIQAINTEIFKPKLQCTSEYNKTFQLFFMHILQSFNIKFEMETLAIPGKHENSTTATAEILLRQSEWYSVVSELAQICLNALEKARAKLEEKKPATAIK